MKEIKSKDNRIFKECQKLSQKKYRDREGRYLIEGENLILEAFDYGTIDYLLIDGEKAGEYDFATARAGETGRECYAVEHKLFAKLAQTETSQGILAVVRKIHYTEEELLKRCGNGRNIVVLDRLQDPGNIGTIIRTSEGAGYGAVVCIKGTGDVFAPKTIRATAGSVFRIPIIHVEDNRELKRLAGLLGKKLTVTSLDTDNYYFDVDLSCNTALVIGNEGRGVSEELMDMADVKIKIPMEGKLESLNAAVAAGILMYEAQRCKSKR